MFGFSFNFGEQMEVFDCTLEVSVGDERQQQRMNAPRMIIEQQFMSLCQDAAQANAPVRVKLSRIANIYDEINDRWIELEPYILFMNNLCRDEDY